MERTRSGDENAYSGPPAGSGAKWTWESASEGKGEMTFTAAVPNERVDYALYFPDFDMRSAGEMKLEPSGQGTRMTWTNQGDVGTTIIATLQAMDRLVDRTETGLKNPKALAERSSNQRQRPKCAAMSATMLRIGTDAALPTD
jgi:hypothetical protein